MKNRLNKLFLTIIVVVSLLSAHRVLSLSRAPGLNDEAAAAFTEEKREFLLDDSRFHSDVLVLRQLLLRHNDGENVFHRRNLVQLDWNQIIADRAKRATGRPDSTADLASR